MSFYLERIVLDLKNHENGIGANLDFAMMKKKLLPNSKGHDKE